MLGCAPSQAAKEKSDEWTIVTPVGEQKLCSSGTTGLHGNEHLALFKKDPYFGRIKRPGFKINDSDWNRPGPTYFNQLF